MGSAPKAPPPPQPSAEERALMAKQGKALDTYLSDLADQKKENRSIGLLTQVSSGLYDPVYDGSGNLIDATLNQGAVDNLRSDIARNRSIGLLQADRMEKALKGELPVSEGLLQKRDSDFKLLKESAARRGINIVGNTIDEAFSTPQDSTAGNESVGNFKRTYGLLEDAERRGEISSGMGVNLGLPTLSLASSSSAYGPGATAPGFGQGAGLLGQALQPYQFNRQLTSQSDLQNAVNRAQQRSDYAGLLGQAGGLAATAAIMSSSSFKEDIRELSEKEEAGFLESLLDFGLKRYRYKGDEMERIGWITEDAPESVVTPDGKHLDVVSYFGYLTGVIREMARRIKHLEAQHG